MREDALKDLSLMNINRATLFPGNINRATLFPGADGLAQSLKVGMSIFSTLEPY